MLRCCLYHLRFFLTKKKAQYFEVLKNVSQNILQLKNPVA